MTLQILKTAAERDIAGNAKCLLVELALRANHEGITDVVGYEELAEKVGVGLSTLYHCLTRLLDRGFVVRVERVPKVGSRYKVLT